MALMTQMIIYEGFIAAVFWAWFVVPIFKVPELTILQAIGLVVAATLYKTTYQEDNIDPLKKALCTVGNMTFLFVIGFIVHILLA